MSDTDNKPADTAATETASTEQWEATLVNGNSYTFGGTKYEKGVTKTVDNATKEALEKRAVDDRIMDGEFDEEGTAVTEPRQKFKFNRVGEKPAPARTRQRATR